MRADLCALLAAALVLLPGAGFAADCTSIHFQKGASSAVLTGTVPPSDSEELTCYTLATGMGQMATVKLTRSNGDTAFSIGDVVDNRDNYSFKTQARTYQIYVSQMSRKSTSPAPYTLSVTVH